MWKPIEFETNYLPKRFLEDGTYYYGKCRNATIARWNGNTQLFYYWRTKLGIKFIETIKYAEDDIMPHDVFFPYDAIGKNLENIPMENY